MVKQFLIGLVLIVIGNVADAKDPTRPIVPGKKTGSVKTKAVQTKQPLTAIFKRQQQRFAIIEGKNYRVGDYYRGSRITKIFQDKVQLRSTSGNFYLTLIPKIKK